MGAEGIGVSRFTTFRYTLDPTRAQAAGLARHAGASRFAFNQCLRLATDALAAHQQDPSVSVPWSGFDLINAFNAWKTSAAAGRLLVASPDGTLTVQVGLPWRRAVCAQVFEEAAVDLSRGLAAWSSARHSQGVRPVGFPRFKRKSQCVDSFRVRTKAPHGRASIRVGQEGPRSVTLPVLGVLRVREDTRALRRLLRARAEPAGGRRSSGMPDAHEPSGPGESAGPGGPRARILFATVTRRAHRWVIALTIQAPELHPARRHRARPEDDSGGWVGLDRGLRHLVVAADARRTPLGVWAPPPFLRPQPRQAPAGRPGGLTPTARLGPPYSRHPLPGPRASARRFAAPLVAASGLQPTGPDPRPAGAGDPGHRQPARQPPPGPGHQRRRLGPTSSTAHLQTGVAGWPGPPGSSLAGLLQDLLSLRPPEGDAVAARTDLHLPGVGWSATGT
jgi:hypothetical protein